MCQVCDEAAPAADEYGSPAAPALDTYGSPAAAPVQERRVFPPGSSFSVNPQ